MKTYNLSKPMTYAEFLTMPDDLQAQYLRSLRWRFGASDKRIAEMMGVSHPLIKSTGSVWASGSRREHACRRRS